MSKIICSYLNYMFFFVILFIYILTHIQNYQTTYLINKEGFTPGIRKLVRPHLRNLRTYTESYTTDFKENSNKLLQMVGLQFV